MGCWNVACSISKVSIGHGDKVLFIPLMVNKDLKEAGVNGLTQMHYILDVDMYYKPFCLPIEAQYDDYGGLEKVVKTANTDAIEKLLGIKIQDFLKIVCQQEVGPKKFQKSPYYQMVKDLGGMFIHKEVYQELAKTSNLINSDRATPTILEKLGFTLEGKHPTDKSHGYEIWNHPENPDLRVLSSRDYYSSFCDKAGNRDNSIWFHTMQHFAELVMEKFGVALDLSQLDEGSQYDLNMDELSEKMKMYNQIKGKERKDQIKMLMKPENELFYDLLYSSPLSGRNRDIGGMQQIPLVSELYSEVAETKAAKKECTDFMSFYRSMYLMNCMLFPNLAGPQSGDQPATQRMLKAAMSVLDKKLKREEE